MSVCNITGKHSCVCTSQGVTRRTARLLLALSLLDSYLHTHTLYEYCFIDVMYSPAPYPVLNPILTPT